MSKVTGKRVVFIQMSRLLTVEWPSLLPFSSVTAMPFRISLEKEKRNIRKNESLLLYHHHPSPFIDIYLLIFEHVDLKMKDFHDRIKATGDLLQ